MQDKNKAEKEDTTSRNRDFLQSVAMGDDDFARFSGLVQDLCGIRMPPVKKTMLEARLRKRMRALGLASFRDYWNYLNSKKGRLEEVIPMIDAVTTNKTDFFREPAHLEYLYNNALPHLLTERDPYTSRAVRIWSAGCSTGMEAYSIAMIMSEFSLNSQEITFSIIGTDISVTALGKAAKGTYDREKADTIPFNYRKKYLLRSRDRSRGLVRVAPEIRALVRFAHLNFLDREYGFEDPFDIVFCRNVIIYFDREIQRQILTRICRYLRPGGYLFTGHSETLHGMALPIDHLAPSVYRKEG